jgi:hypothetical protein
VNFSYCAYISQCSTLPLAQASSKASGAESAGNCRCGSGGGARWLGCAVRDGRSGRRPSVDDHAEKRPCAVQLRLGGRGSPLSKVQVFRRGPSGRRLWRVAHHWGGFPVGAGRRCCENCSKAFQPLRGKQRHRPPRREPP